MKDEKAIPILLEAMKDENADIHWKSMFALGRMGDMRTLKVLRSAQNDKYLFVKDKAGIIIHKILKKQEKISILNFDNGEMSFDYWEHWEIDQK